MTTVGQPDDVTRGLQPKNEGSQMANKVAYVKVKYDDTVKEIEVTDAKDDGRHLVLHVGKNIVGRFGIDQIERWWLESKESS